MDCENGRHFTLLREAGTSDKSGFRQKKKEEMK